jgi:hypothetical protein
VVWADELSAPALPWGSESPTDDGADDRTSSIAVVCGSVADVLANDAKATLSRATRQVDVEALAGQDTPLAQYGRHASRAIERRLPGDLGPALLSSSLLHVRHGPTGGGCVGEKAWPHADASGLPGADAHPGCFADSRRVRVA